MAKTEYLDTMEIQIEEWGIKIEDLVGEAEKAHEANRGKLYSQIKSLRTKQECLRKKYEKLKEINDEKARIRNEVEEVLNSLKKPLETTAVK